MMLRSQILEFTFNNTYLLPFNLIVGLLSTRGGLNRFEYLRGTLEMRRHFETPCGSYMGDNTLESMQQWLPSNLTVDATILPEDIGGTGDLCCSLYHSCIFLN